MDEHTLDSRRFEWIKQEVACWFTLSFVVFPSDEGQRCKSLIHTGENDISETKLNYSAYLNIPIQDQPDPSNPRRKCGASACNIDFAF